MGDDVYYRIEDPYYTLSGAIPHLMSDGLGGYGPRDYTYLGARNIAVDLVETQKGINFISIKNLFRNFLDVFLPSILFARQYFLYRSSTVTFNIARTMVSWFLYNHKRCWDVKN